MTMKKEAWRAKVGQSVTDYENQINNDVARLKAYKTQLNKLKSNMETEPEHMAAFTAADIAEVDAVLAYLNTQIATI